MASLYYVTLSRVSMRARLHFKLCSVPQLW